MTDIRTMLGNRVSVTLPKQAMPLLEELLATRLWGSTRAAVARSLLMDSLMRQFTFVLPEKKVRRKTP